MPTPKISDALCIQALDAVALHGSQIKAAAALKISRGGLQSRIITARQRQLRSPIANAPKIRVAVSYMKNEGGWSGDVLAIGDTHDSPKIDKSRFLWLGKMANDLGVDRIIQIGDFLTFDSLCSLEANDTLRGKEKPTFELDIESGHEAMMAFDRGLKGHDCPKHVTLGNHEDRAISFTNRTPEVAGMLTGHIDNLFMSHKWTYSPYGLVYFLGSVGFVHAPLNTLRRPYGGKTAMQRIANDVCHDLVYGHDHKGGDFPCPKIGTNQKITILNLGCALPDGYVESYVGHGTSGWKYGANLIKIRDGRIAASSFTPMTELEEKYA